MNASADVPLWFGGAAQSGNLAVYILARFFIVSKVEDCVLRSALE